MPKEHRNVSTYAPSLKIPESINTHSTTSGITFVYGIHFLFIYSLRAMIKPSGANGFRFINKKQLMISGKLANQS